MSDLLVDAPEGITMTVEIEVRHLCPFVDERDEGIAIITWISRGKTFELHELKASLTRWIGAYSNVRISHEDYTLRLKEHLNRSSDQLDVVKVRTDWNTAGLPVTVTT